MLAKLGAVKRWYLGLGCGAKMLFLGVVGLAGLAATGGAIVWFGTKPDPRYAAWSRLSKEVSKRLAKPPRRQLRLDLVDLASGEDCREYLAWALGFNDPGHMDRVTQKVLAELQSSQKTPQGSSGEGPGGEPAGAKGQAPNQSQEMPGRFSRDSPRSGTRKTGLGSFGIF